MGRKGVTGILGFCSCLILGTARILRPDTPLGFAPLPTLGAPEPWAAREITIDGVGGRSRTRRAFAVYAAATTKKTTPGGKTDLLSGRDGSEGSASPATPSSVAKATAVASTPVRPAAAAEGGADIGGPDPFRPERASIDPMVINILVKQLGEKGDAERVCNKAIRKRMQRDDTTLTAEEKRLVYKRVYGVEVLRERLAHLLRHAVRTSPIVNSRFGPTDADFGLPMNATGDPMLVVNRAECLLALYMLTVESVGVEFLDSDRLEVLRGLVKGGALDEAAVFGDIQDPAERLAARRSMPVWLARQWVLQYGEQAADELAAKINRPCPPTLRVNTLKTTRDAVMAELSRRGLANSPTRYSPWGITIEGPSGQEGGQGQGQGDEGDASRTGRLRIMDQDIFLRGYVDVMTEASQCVALSTGVRPFDIVLVSGAKRGLKALALASMLRGNGMLYLWEPYERQRHHIADSVRRGGVAELVEVLPNINAAMRIKADVVLVDALCSTTGAVVHHPSLRWKLDEAHIRETLVQQQRSDLQNAARAVSPGGILVYSTCSLLSWENEEVADWFEQSFADEFEPLPFDKSNSNRRVLLPHVHGVDGTFICRWKRKGE